MAATIRPIAAGDHDEWVALFTAYGVFYETEFTEPQMEAVWGWLMDPTHPHNAWVAQVDGELVGFAHLRQHSDTFSGGPAWYLDDLFTAPAARGLGVGTDLIAALRAHADAHGGGTISWITADDNLTAQRVYDKLATRTRWVTYELPG
jgi:GNAT superfamily N-acetyltransferase